jgi:hypothetical protein
MRMKSLKKYAPLGLLLAVTVRAQTPPPPPTTPADIRLRITSLRTQIEDDHRHVLHLQAVTRKEKDVIKLTCVNDKLILINAQADLFDGAALQVEGSLESGDPAQKTSSLADAETAGDAVKKLRTEADGCVGELEMYKQESGINVERPPDLPDPTDTGDGFDGDHGPPDIEVPGFSTPFR